MKNIVNKLKYIIPILAAIIILSACNKDDDEVMPNPAPQQMDIVETAASNSDFSTLVAAVQKAGLVDALKGSGPFTVFAPTNQAFENLFNALGVNGIDDLSAEALTPILLYHVIGAEFKSTDLTSGYAGTLNTSAPGNNSIVVQIDINSGSVKINSDINVTEADIEASNGVIHVIDKVMLPPDIVDIAIANSNFSILVSAVVKAGLVDALKGEGPFTVFAPTNTAFEMLFADLGINGIDDLTAEQLAPILLYHVVSGNVRSTDVSSQSVPTLNGASMEIEVSNSGVTINGNSNVIAVDVQGTNGVIHVIDKVILPPTK
jgi:transforming growth factor-beta-induced protein